MSAIDHALQDAGVAVAPLWPSTIRFYRLCGWEATERGQRHTVAIRSFRHLTGEGQIVRDPGEAIFSLQADCAVAWNGPLGRPPWWWEQRLSTYLYASVPPEQRFLYGWSEGGRLTGFLEYLQRPSPVRGSEIVVAELWVKTIDALKGLCGVLGSHEAQVDEVIFPFWVLPNRNDLLWLLPEAERTVRTEGRLAWMLRLIDPAAALQARGWPAPIASRLELEVTDPPRREAIRIILEVGSGRASVTVGGSGRVRLGAGALASWYAGALRATHGARLGLVQASPADLDVMDSMTADRPVWLSEYF
jgi:predicted acetyltransferase